MVACAGRVADIRNHLIFNDDVLGLLDIQSDKLNAFTEDDQMMFEAVADTMAAAIRKVYMGERYVSAEVAEKMAFNSLQTSTESPFNSLSKREMQVMFMITSGLNMQDMVDRLFLSSKTINGYRYRTFEKLAAKNDVELTYLAMKHSVIVRHGEEGALKYLRVCPTKALIECNGAREPVRRLCDIPSEGGAENVGGRDSARRLLIQAVHLGQKSSTPKRCHQLTALVVYAILQFTELSTDPVTCISALPPLALRVTSHPAWSSPLTVTTPAPTRVAVPATFL